MKKAIDWRQRASVDRRTVLKGLSLAAFGSGIGHASAQDDLPNTITISGDGGRTRYELAVSGRIEKGPNANPGDTVFDEQTAGGTVGNGGTDDFVFSGEVTDFTSTGPAAVSVNGQGVDDPVGEPSDGESAEQDDAPRQGESSVTASIEQGNECATISPLSYEDLSVEEFYGYTEAENASEGPYQSNTPGTIGKPDVSYVFLYEGPGGLSLVFIHGRGGFERGGAVSFEITGLPAGGEWIVRNDDYADDPDEWQVGGTSTVAHWSWNQYHDDGGAFRGLGDEFEVQITPAFNGAAELDPLDEGEISSWQVISEDEDGRSTAELALDRPIVVRSGSCE